MNYLIFLLSIFNLSFAGMYNGKHAYLHAQILNNLINEVSKKYNVEVYSKGGSFVYNLKKFNISFRYRKCIDLISAERMYIEINELILKRYNSDLSIRPYLDVYPFTPSRVELGLWFSKNKCVGDIISIIRYSDNIIYSYLNEDGTDKDVRSNYQSLYNHAYGLIESQDGCN